MLNNLDILTEKALKIFTVIAFLIGVTYLLSRPAAGDDVMFIENLDLIKSKGWYEAITSKISIPYLILAYPFSFLFSNFFALRLVNVLLFLLLTFYFIKRGAIKNNIFFFFYLFYSSTGWFVSATNDTLFVVALVVFINEVYKLLSKENGSVILVWCSIFTVFFTRELVVVYLPVILFSFYLLNRKGINLFENFLIPLSVLVFFVVINLPSIIENHSLSYDNKIPPTTAKSNWAQRQYLAQLMVNEGTLAHNQHPSWEETDAYLIKNGANSLPETLFRGMLFDLKLTFKEFFKDFAEVIFISVRQLSLILILVFLQLLFQVYKRKIDWNLYLPFISLLMVAIFSLIIISYVETRWLIPIFIMTIVYYTDFIQNNKAWRSISLLNNILTILIVFFGIYKIVLKIEIL